MTVRRSRLLAGHDYVLREIFVAYKEEKPSAKFLSVRDFGGSYLRVYSPGISRIFRIKEMSVRVGHPSLSIAERH